MRYIMKGGVWKNSEDEILKAAIMKYGLNQWSRISSLLQRKSAKQCKQRWYEWLDPSIKKTEWIRAEDQKLLQLARVFPSQWRTIAPFVGRTPTQCYQRYQKLLDVAQGKSIKQAEDLRRLRPGQIDPNPETKPARLDPIDMDEDEKQMLAEVRVRLANTKGKKAKRKEREKVIEEARRLAKLQKVRELQMAGVDDIPTAKEIKRMRQKKDLDYNREIPFKRDAPEFVYKTEEGQTPKNTAFASTITLQTLEGKRRDVEQELQRKLDRRRMKKFRERDLKAALSLKNDIVRPASLPINLPQPQINEKDLQNMKKFNITTPLNTLLLNSQTPYGMTPQNKIMYSARINLSLNHQEGTPLNDQIDGVEGMQYLKEMEKKGNGMRSIDRVISERMKTPLNEWEQDRGGKVKSLFKNLKKPENIVEFDIPEEEEQQQEDVVLDAQVVEKMQQQKMKKEELQKQKLQTEVIKRGIVRPKVIPSKLKPQGKSKIQQLIEQQMLSLIYSDGIDNPIDGVIFPDEAPPYKEYIPFQKLEAARQMVAQQLLVVKTELVFNEQTFSKARKHVKLDYTKKQATIVEKSLNQNQEIVEQYEEYKLNLQQYRAFSKKVDGSEKKTKKLLNGYEKIIKTKIEEINNLQREYERIKLERVTLQNLMVKERGSMGSRIGELQTYYRLIYNSI